MEEFKLRTKKLAAEVLLRQKYKIEVFETTVLNVDCGICTKSLKSEQSFTTPNENFYCRECLLTNIVEYKRPNSPTTNTPYQLKELKFV